MAQRVLLQSPEKFDFDHRQLGQACKAWKQRFLIYIDAADYDTASTRRRYRCCYMPQNPKVSTYITLSTVWRQIVKTWIIIPQPR